MTWPLLVSGSKSFIHRLCAVRPDRVPDPIEVFWPHIKDIRMFRPLLVGLCSLLVSVAASAQTDASSLMVNPTLQIDSATGPAPSGWRLDGTALEFAADSSVKRNGLPSLRVKFAAGAPYAGILQRLAGERVSGRTLVIDGWLARDTASASVGVWVRAFDKERKSIAYVNSYEQANPADGTFTRHRVELKVPDETVALLIGASIYGDTGSAWFSSVDAHVEGPK
jgi:hypothetical protein